MINLFLGTYKLFDDSIYINNFLSSKVEYIWNHVSIIFSWIIYYFNYLYNEIVLFVACHSRLIRLKDNIIIYWFIKVCHWELKKQGTLISIANFIKFYCIQILSQKMILLSKM